MTSIVSWLLGAAPRAQAGNPLDDRYYEGLAAGQMSRAGVAVSADTAMKVGAVYRCVSILANSLALFPKAMFEKLEKGRREATDHPLHPIISFKPNQRQSAFEFWRMLCFHLVLRQNAFAQIVPGAPGRGWVGQLVPLHPDRVRGPEELEDGRLRYEYTRGDGRKFKMIGGLDIWHLTGLSSDGLRGMSMIDLANDSIGLAAASERHAARTYGQGIKSAGILQSERTLKPDTAKEMGESFVRAWGGEAGVGKVPVLWEGMKFQPVSMTLKDAEFLDSRKYSVAEIARWFGVPPHMVGDVERSTSWGTGIEQQGLQFLIYSLMPWIALLEQSIRFTLVVQPDTFYPKFNESVLLRMDQKAQADVFSVLIDKGVLNPNECRELLDRNPRDGGDEYVDVAKPPAPPPRPGLPFPPKPDPDEEEEEEEDDEPSARAIELARRLATARAEELMHEEDDALCKMARQHAKDSEGWRSAVAGFYGRFARRIASTGICSAEVAKAWCNGRRDLVLADGGLHLLTTDHPASNAALLEGLPC